MRSATRTEAPSQAGGDRYKWVALANTPSASA
jgi:hypothetical protein